MHHKKAGKQTIASGMAMPFKKLRKIGELQAKKAKIIAAIAIFGLNFSFFKVTPITKRASVKNTKNVADEI